MTADEFRTIALSMQGAVEGSHMNHPDFRVHGKIFASLAKEGLGMVKLTTEEQRIVVQREPAVFEPCAGAWGRAGCTYVRLAKAGEDSVCDAMQAAWRNTPSKGKRSRRG